MAEVKTVKVEEEPKAAAPAAEAEAEAPATAEDAAEDAAEEGKYAGMTKSQKKRAKQKAAAERKAEGGGAEGEGAAPAEGEEAAASTSSKKKKKKKGGGTAGQTWPEPTIPVSKLFPSGVYPEGQIMEYPGDNAARITNEEKRDIERLETLKYNELRRGAEVHRQVRKYIQNYIEPGMFLIDITNKLEAKVEELIEANGLEMGKAFPTGCSINHVAAHYTPNHGDKTVLKYDDVVKFDFGTHVSGRIIDCAWTHNFNKSFDPLKEAARAATEEGIKHAGPDARLGEIGGYIQEVMESHEIEIQKKVYTIKSIQNLSGHSIEPYRIHAGKSVPLVPGPERDIMEEGEVYAIETFGSTGKGSIYEDGECSHYMRNFDVVDPVVRYASFFFFFFFVALFLFVSEWPASFSLADLQKKWFAKKKQQQQQHPSTLQAAEGSRTARLHQQALRHACLLQEVARPAW